MSTDFDLFVQAEITAYQLAEKVHQEMGGDLGQARDQGWCVAFQPVGYPGYLNVFIEPWYETPKPDLEDVFLGYNLHFMLEYTHNGDVDRARELARYFSKQFASRIDLPAILVENFTWVLSVSEPKRGYREFREETMSAWAPYESLWACPGT